MYYLPVTNMLTIKFKYFNVKVKNHGVMQILF